MDSQAYSAPVALGRTARSRINLDTWTALALCAAVALATVAQHIIRSRPDHAAASSTNWTALVAAAIAAAGIIPWRAGPGWLSAQRALHWVGILSLVWAANGIPLDLLSLTRLLPLPVDVPGLVTKALALVAVLLHARLALARRAAPSTRQPATWYGYAAFVLALPYPMLRTIWAMGGMIGLSKPGAGGHGWAPWLFAIPWLMAAVLSLLLVPTWRWMPRRLLLVAGWTATTIVGMIGPVAVMAFISVLRGVGNKGPEGMALWVPGVFYGSWFLWAIAAGAATRSYQLRTASMARPAEPDSACS